MRRLRLLVVAGALVAIGSPWVAGQDKGKDAKSKEPPPAKLKGQLPPNWGKLGLSEDQKQKVYEVQGKYHKDLEELRKKMDELKDKEKKDLEEVLTKDQKAKLKDIISGKVPGDAKDKDGP